jgi:hypothetical protein
MGCTTSSEVVADGTPTVDFGSTKLVFVLGGPGSGKGTLCDRLGAATNFFKLYFLSAHLQTF